MLLINEILIPSLSIQNKIVAFFDINYSLINQIKKQIETVNILKYNYIETICNNYPMIKIKELCNVDVKPINCDINSDIVATQQIYPKGHINNILSLCVQRNSKSAGNTFYYETKNNYIDPKGHINTNIFYLNNIKNTTVELLYILLKHNETNLNKLASITNTINLSRSNLENFEIKNIPLDIQHKVVYKINEYDNMIKSYLKNIDNLINTNIFN
jgi:restriction endonuclease S subunit